MVDSLLDLRICVGGVSALDYLAGEREAQGILIAETPKTQNLQDAESKMLPMSKSAVEQINERDPLRVPRRFFLAIFIFALVGTGTELLLLEHFEASWQKVPLALMSGGLITLGWHGLYRRAASVRLFQGMMILFLVGGVAGLILHYRGNVEFELEMHPAAEGFKLVMSALMGATPVLAPGTMIQLGLLGLAYTYRHPALSRSKRLASEEAVQKGRGNE